jgi:hypothetical protein
MVDLQVECRSVDAAVISLLQPILDTTIQNLLVEIFDILGDAVFLREVRDQVVVAKLFHLLAGTERNNLQLLLVKESHVSSNFAGARFVNFRAALVRRQLNVAFDTCSLDRWNFEDELH